MRRLGCIGIFLSCVLAIGCGQSGGDIGIEQQQADTVGGGGPGETTCSLTSGGMGPRITFQNGEMIGGQIYRGGSDAMLIANSPTTNYGQYTFLKVKGGSDKRHDVLRWDLTSLPSATTTITAACLQLTITYSSARTFPAFEVLRAWDEAGATWNMAAAGVPWQGPGGTGAGDIDSTELGVIPAGAPVGTFAMELPLALVRAWVASPSTNHGIMFANDAANDPVQFASQQASNVSSHPKLVLQMGP